LRDEDFEAFCFLAAFMLSTRLGYFRPAFLAAALAFDLLLAVSLVWVLFFGAGFSHGSALDFFGIQKLRSGEQARTLGMVIMRIREFRSALWLPFSPEEVFPFFGDATNLDAITPPWMHFHTITPPPIVMKEGTLIDYRLRVRGVPIRWRTRISAWEPSHRFVDEQLRGPYRQWIHEHTFEPKDGGTLARDVVKYAVPFDFFVHSWLVRPDVEKIFQHRTEALKQRFPGSQEVAG
jgi:ligand-binding SRPBCC domain-containing protein